MAKKTKEKKKGNTKNKTTEVFKRSIHQYLDGVAKNNEVFAKKLKDPKKNIDDCVTYILNQVKASGVNGFENSEIYGMAMHYYDEKDVKVGSRVNAQVVVNHQIELTEEEIKELKEKARQKVIDEETARLRKKPDKKKNVSKTDKKQEPGTLF